MPTPLPPHILHILLSLADSERHGYAIIGEIRDRTAGDVRLTASTLYASLKRLLDQGWIDELDPPADERDSRRRYYRLTHAGREAGRAEAARLQALTEMARASRWLPRKRASRG